MSEDKRRQVYGDSAVLKKCLADEKFAYVVALARAVNTLNSAHSLMLSTMGKDTPEGQRDRTNSHFLISGVLYETLKLIRTMSQVFKDDRSFETSLRLILRDPSGQLLEQMHLKQVRHGGIFHFLPDEYAKALAKTHIPDCVFVDSSGKRKGSLHYAFADLVTVEMMVGTRLDDEVVVNHMMEKTFDLVVQFIDHSENFIAAQLNGWGFEIRST